MPTTLDTAARLTQLADRVVDALNAAAFSQDFTAARYSNRRLALAEVSGWSVAVLKEGLRRGKLSRASRLREFDIHVAVIKPIGDDQDENDAADEALLLAEELADELEKADALVALDDGGRPVHTETTIQTSYSPEHFEQMRLVLCPMTLSYRIFG